VIRTTAARGKNDTEMRGTQMPLWKIHHPVGAYSLEDKNEFAEAITQVYEAVPSPGSTSS
jgi:hypothetical protein